MDTSHQSHTEPKTLERVKTPEETRNLAYELWAFACARSWKLVAEKIGCAEYTLQRWAKADGWEERRRKDLASSVPGMVEETAVGLTVAAYHANMRLQQIAYDSAHNGTVPNTKEVQALTLIVDRGGFSPLGGNKPMLPELNTSREEIASTGSLTREQLIERERQRRQGRARQE